MITNLKLFIGTIILCLFFTGCTGSKKHAIKSSSETAENRINPYFSRTDTQQINVSNAQWKKILNPELYKVARLGDTEVPFTGKYNDFKGLGIYYCAVCGNQLFRSDSKFSSTCGWPSFFEPSRKNSVVYKQDTSYGMVREEVLCGRCKSHLGHVFDDGPEPTGKRYCMNSICLDFVPD